MELGTEQLRTRRQILNSNLKFLFVAGGGLFGDGYLNTTIGLGTSMPYNYENYQV